MSFEYERLPDPGDGLRLHLNENTAGCSPRVLDALARLTRLDAAFYPDYTAVTACVAASLDVAPETVLVVNGLDEGLHAAAMAALLRGEDGRQREALIVEPAFDMYAACADAVGARIVFVPPHADFTFPLREVLAAVNADTGLVYLTSPNNPTGLSIPRAAVFEISRSLPADALLFLDEAYVDFAESTLLDAVQTLPNLVIGRTFAKAQGLAAVRAGAVVAPPIVMSRLRKVVPPYSVNVFAAHAIVAALEDRTYLAWYRDEVARSRELVYACCRRLGLTYWPSEANFVLIRVGHRAGDLVKRLADRRIFIRDRTSQPGCAGCVRITTGVVEHTERCLAAMEEILCDAR
jgi:histidinol-phosphate aminotransferase